ncbi:MAG: proliferating cell nuclear antigen (pcna) [Promethearchaeota archaeon]|nr:MAG: proliferating cell nuclear antigen (pcna) [Candidatus Lokiarchaeota archaeon]
MFKAVHEDPNQLIKIFDAIATMINDATLNVSKAGVSIRAMDPTHVAMIDLELPKEAFKSLECDRTTPIRINLPDLNRFMKRGVGSEAIEFDLDETQNKFKILFRKGKSRRTFKLGLLAEGMEEKEPPNPTLDLNAKFNIKTDDFQRAIKDALLVGDFVTFSLVKNELKLDAGGTESGDVSIIFEDIQGEKTDVEETGMYSLEFLDYIIKAGSVCNEVNIEFASEMPIKFDFNINPGRITYLLAPRVETEEEDGENIISQEDDVALEENDEESFDEPFEDDQ